MQPGLDKLVVGADYIKLIWVPDTFFVNEKVASFHQATQVGHQLSSGNSFKWPAFIKPLR
jgi:hypothetical protein